MAEKRITVPAFAKVNLTLEVLGCRTDGYHALRSIVQQISLFDTVTVSIAKGFHSNSEFKYDLALKAAQTLANVAGINEGVSIEIVKRIPVGGGLGGGSADAAATLLALNDLWEIGWSREKLAAIAAQIGSDVPALVLGGTVLMQGRGEIVSPLFDQRTQLKEFYLVLINPGVFCSTKEVYLKCNSRLQEDPRILYNMSSALQNGDEKRIASAMMNDLQISAVKLHPEITAALKALEERGTLGAMMSGSGSTVFGLVSNEAEGRKIADEMRKRGFWAECVHTIVR